MRETTLTRKTGETDIRLSINLDGAGNADIATGIGFFDHMLTALSRHSSIDVTLRCDGDTSVDAHHSVEDCGILLGKAVAAALGDKKGIRRFGFASAPLDEALSQATVDISGRGALYLHNREILGPGKVGEFDTELTEEFFTAFAANSGLTLHLELRYGRNRHHIIESAFKAVARALREAVEPDPRALGVPSTKGVL